MIVKKKRFMNRLMSLIKIENNKGDKTAPCGILIVNTRNFTVTLVLYYIILTS